MTSDRRAALIKSMIDEYECTGWGNAGMSAALDIALEEAAKVVLDHANTRGKSLTNYAQLMAAAIRALKVNP